MVDKFHLKLIKNGMAFGETCHYGRDDNKVQGLILYVHYFNICPKMHKSGV